MENKDYPSGKLQLYVFSLALGCVIGWGCFIIPGKMLLPTAGAVGSVIGIVIAAVIASCSLPFSNL